MLSNSVAASSDERMLYTNSPDLNAQYCNNRVVTSKYTIFSFLPKILWTQVTRFMNFYFLVVGSLQMWSDVSPVDPLTTWIPVIVIFTIAFAREGFDDYRLHKLDAKTNSREYKVHRNGLPETIRSEEIQVGDFLYLEGNMEIPADLVLLYAEDGSISIETANLDGETSLKARYPPGIRMSLQEILDSKLSIRCSEPNKDLYDFAGRLNGDITLSKDNFVQCGSFTRFSEPAVGVVVYTGNQTKLGLNSVKPPIKWTRLERLLDRISVWIFIAQWLIALVMGTIAGLWNKQNSQNHLYLLLDTESAYSWIVLYVRFYLLTSMMIPISLKVTIDASKAVYGVLVMNDKKLVDKDRQLGATVNNSSVAEDLGAIQYVFTDKTGTLTENKMILKRILLENCEEKPLPSTFSEHPHIVFLLGLCHTAKVNKNSEVTALSPEEGAFLRNLIEKGLEIEQDHNRFTFKSVWGINEGFQILAVLPFSYERKMMSVVARRLSDGHIFLYSKGAPESISSRSFPVHPDFPSKIKAAASLGLRVMSLSMREVSQEEFDMFSERLNEVQEDISNRTEKEELLFREFETHSKVIGAAAIEDKLQDGVPETIARLMATNIRIWMATGDVMQTAIRIAHTTNLITNDGPIIDLSMDSNIEKKLSAAKQMATGTYYLVIQGGFEELIKRFSNQFIELALNAKCVVLSRATPSEKALAVFTLQSLGKMTLAIGDGGNDVQMIRAAHIGVGIAGKEGMQAAAAADFSISHFRFLERLLLIHGRYSAYRTSWLCQFCLYKATLVALIQVLYSCFNGISGTSFFNSFNLMCYNAVFTILPVVFFLLDKDLDEKTVLNNPFVYEDSQNSVFCNRRTIFWWYLKGIYQAIVLMLSSVVIFDSKYADTDDGSAISLDEMQQAVYTAIIFIVCLTVTLDTKHFYVLNLSFIWGSWVLYVVLACIANSIFQLEIIKEMYIVMWRVLASPMMWHTIIMMVSICVVPPFIVESFSSIKSPTRTQRIHEIEIESMIKGYNTFVVSNAEGRDDRLTAKGLRDMVSIWDKHNGIFASCSNSGCCDL